MSTALKQNPSIPENLRKYVLPHRADTPDAPKLGSLKKSRKESLDGIREISKSKKNIDLTSLLNISETPSSPEIQEIGQVLIKHDASNKACKAWISLSVRQCGIVRTLRTLLEQSTGNKGGNWTRSAFDTCLITLRAHLAASPVEEYEESIAQASSYAHEGSSVLSRLCFLFPGQQDWYQSALRGLTYQDRAWLVGAIDDLESAEKLLPKLGLDAFQTVWHPNLFINVIHRAGSDSADLICDLIERSYLHAEISKKVGQALLCLPCPSTFQALYKMSQEHKAANEFLILFLDRYPEIALPMLLRNEAPPSLILPLLTKSPSIGDLVSSSLSETETNLLNSYLQKMNDSPEPADSDEIPEILVKPRWINRKTFSPKKMDISLLETAPNMRWPEGLRARWKSKKPVKSEPRDYESYFKGSSDWEKHPLHAFRHLEVCPPEVGEEILKRFRETDPWYMHDYIRGVVERWELKALPLLRRQANHYLVDTVPYFLPFDDAELCLMAAEAYSRLKSVRKQALEYLVAHPETATKVLIPELFGKKKKLSGWAQDALMALNQQGKSAIIRGVAKEYGVSIEKALGPLLQMEALDIVPKKMPEIPTWLHPAALKKPQLKSNGKTLPDDALLNLALMLAISKPGEPYAGLEVVSDACTAGSLADFSWSLFQAWLEAGADAKSYWAFHSLGWFGDDNAVRKLTPLLKKWPGEGAHARAVQGLGVLTSIGTEMALMNLYGLSQKLKFKGLKKQAGERVQEIARARSLTADQLSDRLIPSLDLDEDGSLELCYGRRTFSVGFDEKLKPFVLDEQGKVRKNLPKPGKQDDPESAPVAFNRFKLLKKDVRAIANQQLIRLEMAMIKERRWSFEEFQEYFLGHPLVLHLVRRLIWTSYSKEQTLCHFRVAEDGTLADGEDELWSLPETDKIGLSHPLLLCEESKARWSEILADYEILQPFPQLDREVYPPTSAELSTDRLKRYKGTKVESLRLLSLESKGWQRGEAQDGGLYHWMTKELSGGLHVYLNFCNGIVIGEPAYFPEQTLDDITLHPDNCGWGENSELPLSQLSPIAFSEVIRDLEKILTT